MNERKGFIDMHMHPKRAKTCEGHYKSKTYACVFKYILRDFVEIILAGSIQAGIIIVSIDEK